MLCSSVYGDSQPEMEDSLDYSLSTHPSFVWQRFGQGRKVRVATGHLGLDLKIG